MKNSDIINTLSSTTVESILGKFSVGQQHLPPAVNVNHVIHEAKPPLTSILKSSSPSVSPSVSSRKVRMDVPEISNTLPQFNTDGTFKIGFRRKSKSSTSSDSSPSVPEIGNRKQKDISTSSSKVVATQPIVFKHSSASASNDSRAIPEAVATIPFPAMEFSNAACSASKEELLRSDKSLTVLSLCPLCCIQHIKCHVGSHFSTSLRAGICLIFILLANYSSFFL